MNDPYTAAEASVVGSTVWALIAAVVLLTAVAAMHAPDLRRWVARERRHRADLRRVTEAGR